MTELILLQLVATFLMTGVIWFVQVVHYPLFLLVPLEARGEYCKKHMRRTTAVVLPLMLLEMVTAVLLCVFLWGNIFWLVNLAFILFIWISSFFIQVPLHYKLVSGGDNKIVERLVTGNWIRTILWTIRLGMLTFYLYCLIKTSI
jgi:fatty acid desaturase